MPSLRTAVDPVALADPPARRESSPAETLESADWYALAEGSGSSLVTPKFLVVRR